MRRYLILSFLIIPALFAQKSKYNPDDDQRLDGFLEELARTIEHHQWPELLKMFDSTIYRAQKSMGISDPQFIEEGLGLGMKDNQLIDRFSDESEFHRLNGVAKVSFGARSMEIGAIVVRGHVILANGQRRKITLYIAKHPRGRYLITPAVG